MRLRLLGSCFTLLVLSFPAVVQEKQPAEEPHYARAEIRGKLVQMGLKEKSWHVIVGGQKMGEGAFFCPLLFANAKAAGAAKDLENQVVIVTGDLSPNPHPPGIGGESAFFLPGPIIDVKTLRAAAKKKS